MDLERNQAAKDKRGIGWTAIRWNGWQLYRDRWSRLRIPRPRSVAVCLRPSRSCRSIFRDDSRGTLEKAEKKQKEEEEKDRIFRQAHDCCFQQQGTDREVWKVRLFLLRRNLLAIRNHELPPWWAAYSRMSLLLYRLRNRWCLRFPITKDFLKKMKKRYF